jgi:tetratricopeptide (TPR) repeat protein
VDPFLIFVVVGGAAWLSGPLSTLYQNHLLNHSSQKAICLEEKGETEKAIRHLKWALFCLSLQPKEIRIHQHMTLGTMYLRAQRFAEGENHLRNALEGCRKLKKSTSNGTTEAHIRTNIAMALEAQGNIEGATAERDIARDCLLNEENRNYSWHLLRASDLKQRKQYAEAVIEYKIGLQEYPPSAPAFLRGQEILSISVCLSELGHITDSLSYLEKSLACSPPIDVLANTYFLLGIHCQALNRLEDAERYYKAALTIDNEKALGEMQREALHWEIGNTQLLHGDLQDACQTLNSFSETIGVTDSPYAEFLASDLEMENGEFTLSFSRLKRLRQSINSGNLPSRWQKEQSSLEGDLSVRIIILHLLLKEPDNALTELAELENIDSQEEGTVKWTREAYEILALAYSEITDERKSELQDRVLKTKHLLENDFTQRLNEGAEFADAAIFLRLPTNFLAHAALSLGMTTVSLQLSQRYLEMNPYKVNLPEAYCLIGECQAALGNQEDARAAWQTAVSFGIDTYRSRTASQYLAKVRPHSEES